MRYILLLYLCMFCTKVCGQQCGCAENFQAVMNKMRTNYVGYNDKITAQNRNAFNLLTDSIKQQALTADTRTCLLLMSRWVAFFKDGHVSVTLNDDTAHHSTIRQLFSNTEQVPVSEQQLVSYLNKQQAPDSLEGIWEDETASYRVGIMRRKPGSAELTAFVLKADSLYWMPGQVKMKLEKKGSRYTLSAYYNRTHILSTPVITAVNRSVLTLSGIGNWYKQYPDKDKAAAILAADPYRPYFKVLDKNTCLLAIPSAMLDYKSEIDSLLKANDALIKHTASFIIDVRGNGGGSVLCFENLLPLLYTRPFISKGAAVMATPDNIRDYYELTDFPNVSDSMKQVFKKEARDLWAHQGGIYNLWPGDTLAFDTVLPYPRKVAILINEDCASSTELFLIKARQSSKVTMYGRHTMGAVDYADAATTRLPCSLFRLRYSTSRSNRLPAERIDNIGIQPQVKIPGNVKDWVEYVRIL